MRKTFKVEDLRSMVNATLANSTGGEIGKYRRQGIQTVLEQVLMDADQYRGFRYLDASEVPAGELPGIVRSDDGTPKNEFPDESRVKYY